MFSTLDPFRLDLDQHGNLEVTLFYVDRCTDRQPPDVVFEVEQGISRVTLTPDRNGR
jgi:hypothetical protein